jgi:branched-chain amino acid transport system ATP-binding protein
MAALLEAHKLVAGYGAVTVLHGLDFAVEQGGITALLGANGAGKTTTLRALSGMVRTAGHITLGGESIAGRKPEDIARRGVAHVPDGRGTIMELTVEENSGRDLGPAMERVFGYFPRLKQRLRQQAGTLSGGEQQMLAIGRALLLGPRLLLLDEPSFGLAPLVVREIFEIMRRVNREDGVGILLVEQNASLALDVADHACLLETGRIVMAGPADMLKRDEQVRRSYLGY